MDPVEGKMSKSDPNAAVTLNDTAAEIEAKMQKAFCPKEAEGNPILEAFRYLIFESLEGKPLALDRPAKFGGPLEFATYHDLQTRYVKGEVHPGDLKAEAGRRLIEITRPVREHFASRPEALSFLGPAAAKR